MKIRVISDVFKRGKINQTTAIARTSIVSWLGIISQTEAVIGIRRRTIKKATDRTQILN